MWFMNHITNPIMRFILSGPLHGIMSKSVLLITYTGRKSGKTFTTPVQYVESNQEIWIMVGFPEKKHWWRNLLGGVPVKLYLRGKSVSGQANLLMGENNRTGIVDGLGMIIQHYPDFAKKYPNYTSPDFDLDGIVLVKVILS
jgi:deazaflavin-dependent oxidoreductase (nitroreductase family)